MKKIIKSKTFWTNVIGVISVVTALKFGYEITPEQVVSVLAVLNIFLRLITKEEIVW